MFFVDLECEINFSTHRTRGPYTRCQTISDSSCETQDSSRDFRTLFVTPTGSICEAKTNISIKEVEKLKYKDI